VRWRIKYSQEADNYFLDNGLLVEKLLYVIIDVAENNGFPVGPYTEGPRIEIAFDAGATQQMIRITQIIPGPNV